MSEDTSPESKRTFNHLKDEKSPYLLQHRDNPVDWYPWGDEAFQKAKDENKPIFLSIGYSTCHWCHVMSRESFEDPEIGQLINEVFVPIKVDREERLDIDSIYMTVCQMITGSGGWPLTIIMTPDMKPFFAGTYFPKDTGPRGTGLRDLILNVHELWENQKDELLKSAEELTATLEKISQGKSGDTLPPEIINQTYNLLRENFDQQYAGFGANQKFPTPHHLLFLLRYWKQTGEAEALNMVQKTLKAMRQGGIYDHLGFGFHRYTVDRQWIIPHFEKMLYDQALLAMVYTEAYQATKETEYRETAEEVLEYLLSDMRSPEGGFYSAEDADSEGEEGKFYLWTSEEIQNLLGSEDGDLFQKVYSISTEGNFKDEVNGAETGKNVLYRTKTWDELSDELEIPSDKLWWKMENARELLFQAREERIHPGKDDKILTDWNGLVIAALSFAGRVFGRGDYLGAAERAVNFIMTNLHSQGRLKHRWREGEAAIEGNLDDYAYLIWGLLELYQATIQAEYLKTALKLNQVLYQHFWDTTEGGYYFTPDYTPQILVRQKEGYDTALPSGNSVQQMNLERLYLLTGESKFRETSEALEKFFAPTMEQTPAAFTMFLSAVMFQTRPSFEVTILGEIDEPETHRMLKALQEEYLPQVVLVLKSSSDNLIEELIPSLKDKTRIDNQTTAYVCGNGTCQAPVNTPAELIDLLK
ncbi:MAG: uncharacterized protein PWQ15_1155 [Methanobacterium sp.]|jgi:uncharacterized protein YyaL (SSP411 family)|uniref:thioredoxin domain-containing protein n=1 Tax=Methanobacterium sp. TaxID=2164 RepID=UPI0003C9D1E8|nr:thioredoxin domain-containing protein [Methanobacterium sp.]MDI3550053.1 uncharacterized protein [Methanobacterium sp.]CDG64989.1 putative protein YyaL [Methanobacterium sp. MB1]